jgi:hypothetical protein
MGAWIHIEKGRKEHHCEQPSLYRDNKAISTIGSVWQCDCGLCYSVIENHGKLTFRMVPPPAKQVIVSEPLFKKKKRDRERIDHTPGYKL